MNSILIHPDPFPLQHVTYRVRQYDGSPHPFVLYRVTTRECQVFEGVTDQHGFTQAIPTRYPDEMAIELPNTISQDKEEH